LSFHSFKKNTVVFTDELSGGELSVMSEKGHHSDPKITKNIYDKHHKRNNYGLQIAETILKDNNSDEIIKRNVPGMFTSELIDVLCGVDEGVKNKVVQGILSKKNGIKVIN